MNFADYILIFAISFLAILTIRHLYKQKKRGGCHGCGYTCSGCSHCSSCASNHSSSLNE